MRFLCKLGVHLRYKPGAHLWHCLGCRSLWCKRTSVLGKHWWEKIR